LYYRKVKNRNVTAAFYSIGNRFNSRVGSCQSGDILVFLSLCREGKGREGKGRKGKERKRKGREGKGREGKEREGMERKGKGREGKGKEIGVGERTVNFSTRCETHFFTFETEQNIEEFLIYKEIC